MTQQEWIVKGRTGISSKTMWGAINGVYKKEDNIKKGFDVDVPRDPSDFGRCYDYVVETGLTDKDIQLVKEVFPWFAPYIDNWDKLKDLLLEQRKTDKANGMYEYMQTLYEQTLILSGFEKISGGNWQRRNE